MSAAQNQELASTLLEGADVYGKMQIYAAIGFGLVFGVLAWWGATALVRDDDEENDVVGYILYGVGFILFAVAAYNFMIRNNKFAARTAALQSIRIPGFGRGRGGGGGFRFG